MVEEQPRTTQEMRSMKHRPKLHLHIGLRTFKTALAVTIALLIAGALDSYSPIFAGLGAIVAMARTLHDALREARTQFVGVILGGAIGFLLLLVSDAPSPLLTGLGVLAAISVCCLFKLYYAVSLSAIIVLSVCVSTAGSPMLAMAYRLLDTSVGLAAGLAVNMLVKPYNNRRRVIALLEQAADSVPSYLDACVLQDLYPDLTEFETALRTLDAELEIYRRQHFRAREAHARDAVFLSGVCQLAWRIWQELSALCCMDVIGTPEPENLERLRSLGLQTDGLPERCCSETVNVVTNYHLEKILDARAYLLELLRLPPEAE